MRDLMAELKELRLHGMANAWADLTAQGESALAACRTFPLAGRIAHRSWNLTV